MIHDALRLIRLCNGYDINKTALLTGINPSDIVNIESGKLDVSDVIIHKYASVFKMSEKEIKVFSEIQKVGEDEKTYYFRGKITSNILRLLNWIYLQHKA